MTTHKDLTIREVADQLGVTPGTIRRYIKAGTLHGYKLPFDPSSAASKNRAEWRIPATEVERIKNARVVESPVFDRQRYMNALNPSRKPF